MQKVKYNDFNRKSSKDGTDSINHDAVIKRIHDAMEGQPEWACIVAEKIVKDMELAKLLEDQKKVKNSKVAEIDDLLGKLEELARQRIGVSSQLDIVNEANKDEGEE